MLRVPFLTNEVDLLLSYNWNYQLPPPLNVMSCFHLLKSKVVKLSSNMILVSMLTNPINKRTRTRFVLLIKYIE